MIKRIILAFATLLLTTGIAIAQNAVPIIIVSCENVEVLYLPEEAIPGNYVDFALRPFSGYEMDTLYIDKVTVDSGIEHREPVAWELVNTMQVGFTMPECDRVELNVKFKKKKYTVTIADGIEHGTVELDSENCIEFGNTVFLKATPDYDYLFGNVTVTREDGGGSISTQLGSVEGNTQYVQFTMPKDNVIVTASFKPVPRYAIEITNGANGTITSDLETARVGDTVTLTVNNDPGSLLTELKVIAGYTVEGGGPAHAPRTPKATDMWYQQQEIELTKVDDHTYQFVLPEQFNNVLTPNYLDGTSFKVTSTFKVVSPAVIWSEEENTLFFIYEENPVEDYEETRWWGYHKVTNIWKGSIISATGWSHPGWSENNTIKSNAQKVVFDEGFANLRPTSCNYWFNGLTNLATIEGLEYLNTSEVTGMNSMFFNCSSLTTLDLNHFDVSKVTNASGMFRVCSDLTTIFCDQTWNIGTASGMFQGASSIVGAVVYDNSKTDGDMANPVTGYFTGKQPINVVTQGNGTVIVPEKEFPTYTVTFTVEPAPLCTLVSITVTGNNSGNTIEPNLSNGVYSFTMPGEPVTITIVFSTPQGETPAALWCEDNSTLYFVNVPFEAVSDGKWDEHTITDYWSGSVVTSTGWSVPGWKAVQDQATRVVFDESFATVLPTSCYSWFFQFGKVASIEGLENLNTSNVTNMNSMFNGCRSLIAIDVNSFDMSRVTNSFGMFRACSNLTTIYCNNTWNIETSTSMFLGSTKLLGAVAFTSEQVDTKMANPYTGYFTGLFSITMPQSSEHGEVTIDKNPPQAYANEPVRLLIVPGSGYTIDWNTSSVYYIAINPNASSAPALKAGEETHVNVTLNKVADNTWEFSMPPGDVVVDIDFVESTPTAIDDINTTGVGTGNNSWYTIDGRYLGTTAPAAVGIYIHNGKKVIKR